MTIRTLLGLGVAAAAIALPTPATAAPAAAPVCAGAPDTGGVCVSHYWYGPAYGYHLERTCVHVGSGCTWVPYPVVDYVSPGQPPVVRVYCTGALDRTLNCPS